MTDKERVIKGLECHADPHAPCAGCPYNDGNRDCAYSLCEDALELLKAWPDIVRCEDCKYYSNGFCYNPNTYDDVITCGNTDPDWYCADGKRWC